MASLLRSASTNTLLCATFCYALVFTPLLTPGGIPVCVPLTFPLEAFEKVGAG
jgi:hypothetical protein